MFLILLILFLVVAFSSFFEHEEDVKKFLFFIFWCLCVAVAGCRDIGCDRDSLVYLSIFNGNGTGVLVEKSFHLISSVVKLCCGADLLFVLFIYAFIGVSAKFLAIRQLTDLWLLTCAIYISNFFMLQDMTQIRIGVATGMMLLCIKPLFERQLGRFLLFVGIAIFFHYSALLILPLWFLNAKNFNRYLYGSLIVLTYCFYFTGLTITEILSYVPVTYIQEKVRLNYEAVIINKEEFADPFRARQVLNFLIIGLLFWKINKVTDCNKYIPLLLKIYIIGSMAFLLFVDVPAFALRISEFFQMVEIILIPSLIYIFKDRKIGIWLPLSIGIFFISMNLFFAQLIS